MNNKNNENKRIDLTQFGEMLNGPWSLVDGNEVLICPTEECLGCCECGKGERTKGPWIWQYIIGADIGTGRDLIMATVDQNIDEVMWKDIPPKEEGIAYATAKAVQMLPDLLAELKRCYEEIDNLVKQKNRLIDIAERGGAWDGGIDITDINEEYGACNICGSIPSGCC